MTIQRRYKVTTTVTQYMWAASRADAEKYQQILIQRGRLSLERDGETIAKFCFAGGDDYVEAPEDISQTRDPAEEPRVLDWLEIANGDTTLVALVTRISRRRVYYYESLSRTERAVPIERWTVWARQHKIHPSYEQVLPQFVIDEVIHEHESRGMLTGLSATPDSSLILEILDRYGYRADDYEKENGYWAENLLDRLLTERILANQDSRGQQVAAGAELEGGDFSIAFSEKLPTFDEFDR